MVENQMLLEGYCYIGIHSYLNSAKILKKVKKTKYFIKKNLPKGEEKPLGRKK